jgi:hypothetical protein
MLARIVNFTNDPLPVANQRLLSICNLMPMFQLRLPSYYQSWCICLLINCINYVERMGLIRTVAYQSITDDIMGRIE